MVIWIAAHLEWFAYAAFCLSCVSLGYALRVTEEKYQAQRERAKKCAEMYSPEAKVILNSMLTSLSAAKTVSEVDRLRDALKLIAGGHWTTDSEAQYIAEEALKGSRFAS